MSGREKNGPPRCPCMISRVFESYMVKGAFTIYVTYMYVSQGLYVTALEMKD